MSKKIILSPDSFKGSLTSERACAAMAEGLESVGITEYISIPVADGGEGSGAVLLSAFGGVKRTVIASDPIGRQITASYALCGKKTIIECASSVGLTLLSDSERKPLEVSSFGVGELFKASLNENIDEIILTLGGSACCDGGAGFLSALGAEFYDKKGVKMDPFIRGRDLSEIYSVSLEKFDERVKNVKIKAVCDVENPLYGKNGAAYVFAPQKGASPDEVILLDNGLKIWSEAVTRSCCIDISNVFGSGAAGGIGAACVLLGAEIVRGSDFILSVSGFDDALREASYVFTGEGRADGQSVMGKVVGSVAKKAKDAGVPVAVFAGSIGNGSKKLKKNGVTELISITPDDETLENAMKNAYDNLRRAVKIFAKEKLM